MSLFNQLISPFTRPAAAEADGAGPSVAPQYAVRETDDAYGLTVYLPGVAKDGLELTAESDQLRIVGRRAWKQPEGWSALYRESEELPFALSLPHDNAVDLDRIHAELADGVLRVSLPKSAELKPRKIAVS
ncbi:MAG TPA: Hsp20/alpha crystallin family protein [Opitutaceae bacterium]|nr:Hsp20/alpha crystallin family protein [Opitutaceae bacterium]